MKLRPIRALRKIITLAKVLWLSGISIKSRSWFSKEGGHATTFEPEYTSYRICLSQNFVFVRKTSYLSFAILRKYSYRRQS